MAAEVLIENLQTGKTWTVKNYQRITFGRAPLADAVISSDGFLSGTHFEVQLVPGAATLRDLSSSNGTFLNGEKIQWRTLGDGDEIKAGFSVFKITISVTEDGASKPMVNFPYELGCSSTLVEVKRSEAG